MADMNRYRAAISGIESGGRYDLTGPTHPRYGRALGRYQVMESNLPEWLAAAGLPAMSGDEFLASPQAQDAVFQHRFGQYVQRHGPEGAAAAWFAGEGGMNDPGRRDVLGTSVADYRRKFMAGLGGGETPVVQAGQPQGHPPMPLGVPAMPATPTGVVDGGGSMQLAMQAAQAAAQPVMQPQQMPQMQVPPMAPRRPIDMTQLRAGLAQRRLGV